MIGSTQVTDGLPTLQQCKMAKTQGHVIYLYTSGNMNSWIFCKQILSGDLRHLSLSRVTQATLSPKLARWTGIERLFLDNTVEWFTLSLEKHKHLQLVMMLGWFIKDINLGAHAAVRVGVIPSNPASRVIFIWQHTAFLLWA